MIAFVILLMLAVLCLAVPAFGTRRLLLLPRPEVRPTPVDLSIADLAIAYEDISFYAADGTLLRGWFFALPGAPVIIYCPGRGIGLNDFDFRYATLFHGGGFQVLMFDWRGMGASAGQSSMGFWEQRDVQAAVAYVKQRCPHAQIGAMGTSLGAAVLFLAGGALPDIAAIAGECAFATFTGMIADGMAAVYGVPEPLARLPAWLIAHLAGWIRGFRPSDADPLRSIGRISPRPVFIIHGTEDRHVPVRSAHALFAAAREPKELWTPAAAHTQGLATLDVEYRQRLLAFFDTWLRSPA